MVCQTVSMASTSPSMASREAMLSEETKNVDRRDLMVQLPRGTFIVSWSRLPVLSNIKGYRTLGPAPCSESIWWAFHVLPVNFLPIRAYSQFPQHRSLCYLAHYFPSLDKWLERRPPVPTLRLPNNSPHSSSSSTSTHFFAILKVPTQHSRDEIYWPSTVDFFLRGVRARPAHTLFHFPIHAFLRCSIPTATSWLLPLPLRL